MLWILISLAMLLISCLMADWNRTHQKDPVTLNFQRTSLISVFLLPCFFVCEWPLEYSFYISAIILGGVSWIAAVVTFDLSRKFNGRIASISQSVSFVFTYIGWLAVDASTREHLTAEPLKAGVSMLLVVFCLISLVNMRQPFRKTDKSKGYLLPTLFVAFITSSVVILGKTILPNNTSAELLSQVMVLSFVIFIVQTVLSGLSIFYQKYIKKKCVVFEDIPLKSIGYLSFLGVMGCITSWAAVALSPNPAYVKAIGMTVPVFILVFHKIKGIEDNANPVAGTVLVISVTILSLL